MFYSNQEVQKTCPFECSVLFFQQSAMRLFHHFVNPISFLVLPVESENFCYSDKKLQESCAEWQIDNQFFLSTIIGFAKNNAAVFSNLQLSTNSLRKFCFWSSWLLFQVGTGTGKSQNLRVKMKIYVRFVQKLLWSFFTKRRKFAQTGSFFETDINCFQWVSFAKTFCR